MASAVAGIQFRKKDSSTIKHRASFHGRGINTHPLESLVVCSRLLLFILFFFLVTNNLQYFYSRAFVLIICLFLFHAASRNEIQNGDINSERHSLSLPGSPAEHKPFSGVIGSAESLVGRVNYQILPHMEI